jgi:hypothetical protein
MFSGFMCAYTQACGADPANLPNPVFLPKAIVANIDYFSKKGRFF